MTVESDGLGRMSNLIGSSCRVLGSIGTLPLWEANPELGANSPRFADPGKARSPCIQDLILLLPEVALGLVNHHQAPR